MLARLKAEAAALVAQLPDLLKEHEGEYAAVYRGTVLAVDLDPHAAYRAAINHPEVKAEAAAMGTQPPILVQKCSLPSPTDGPEPASGPVCDDVCLSHWTAG